MHWARDAGEHNEIVLRIFNERNVKLVIKSKSMLQEECGMTEFISKRGIVVRESDLGERIQQLSHERPSHIVVPSIHKLRTDIAELFANEIGTDANNSDPHYLAESMRQDARPQFLNADAGITGANFAVAEPELWWFVQMRGTPISGRLFPRYWSAVSVSRSSFLVSRTLASLCVCCHAAPWGPR